MSQVQSSPSASPPGIVISALRGGAGKTIFSVGISAALAQKGRRVAPFKKGPDYIDAGWLALAAGGPCYNLDSFLVDYNSILSSYLSNSQDADLSIIEGNRGLYDCIDVEGKTSTAELAKQLGLPVILCLDATKTTRTLAAIVAGCQNFDRAVKIVAVVLNRVAGTRHKKIITDSIEHFCKIPVVGAVPKLKPGQGFPERHMGLVPTPEHGWAKQAVEQIAAVAAQYLDLEKIEALAQKAANFFPEKHPKLMQDGIPLSFRTREGHRSKDKPLCRIGVLRDSAFQFYYPENLEALERAGARLVFTSPLSEKKLPRIDGLYIGGGFPETHARQLAANQSYAEQIRKLAEKGLPIYAECGGLMYLGRNLVLEGRHYPMTGVLPLGFGLSKKPQGHGYTILEVERDNPYFPMGTLLKGHEFHYSTIENFSGNVSEFAFCVKRGKGITCGKDGLCYKNVLATYTHIHALGTPQWAPALVKAAATFGAMAT